MHAATRPHGLFFALAALALGWAALLASGPAFATAPVVIVLSWDGVRHDYPDRAQLPALSRMAREGVRAERLIPVFPTNTFPNHVALATGTHTDRHGILDNQFRDRERGLFFYNNDANWLEAEPLWVAAERQGVRAGVFFWVGSETDWHGVGASYRKTPFDSTVGEEEKVDQILAWLDLPTNARPGLIMSWWHGTDRVGHQKGPDHPDVITQLEDQDRHLARLFAALDKRGAWEHTTVLVVSDHGMTKVDETVQIEAPLARAGIKAEVVGESTTKHVFLTDPSTIGEAETVLRSIAGVTVYRRDALPEHLRIHHPLRNGDLVLVTEPPRIFQQSQTDEAFLSGGRPLGMHGYAPEHPDMGAIFFALGHGVPRGRRIGAVRVIDVAPTVATLLGIAPPRHAEGAPIAGFGVREESQGESYWEPEEGVSTKVPSA